MTSTHTTRDIATTKLPNGVRVITEVMPHVRSVSVGIWVGTGSRREVGAENGISHFIEHMLFKGTENRTAEDIARSVDSIGGNLDAFTSKELVSYNAKVMDEHLPLAFDVLSDLVLHPQFREEDIEKEKGVILEEMKMEVDNPEYLIHEMFTSNFWKGHALGKPIIGTRQSVKKFDRERIAGYYRKNYAPGNILITAAGHLGHDELVRLATLHFAGLSPDGFFPPEATPHTHANIVLRDKRSLEQTHICLGVPSYPLAHEKRFAMYALNTVLGGGMSSRLFQNVREKLGLAYSVFSELNLFQDTGCQMVYAGTSIETARKVIDLILAELKTMKDEQIGAEELRRAKDNLKGSLMLSLESTSNRMANLARQAMFFGKFFTLDELVESIEGVTAAEVQEVAQEFFKPELISCAVLGRLNGFILERGDLAC